MGLGGLEAGNCGNINNVENIWDLLKRAMVESAREVCGSVRTREKNPKIVWWNDEVKAAVRRREAAWKEMLPVSDEEATERCMKAYR